MEADNGEPVVGHGEPDVRKQMSPARVGRIDTRSRRTRAALSRALIELVLEQSYEIIEVVEIARRAGVARSTFYAHYLDKDDLLRASTKHFQDVLVAEHKVATSGQKDPTQRVLGFSRPMFAYLGGQRPLLTALSEGRGGAIVMERLRQVVAELVKSELAGGVSSARQLQPEVELLVGGYMSLLAWWLERDRTETAEEMDLRFRTMILNGLRVP